MFRDHKFDIMIFNTEIVDNINTLYPEAEKYKINLTRKNYYQKFMYNFKTMQNSDSNSLYDIQNKITRPIKWIKKLKKTEYINDVIYIPYFYNLNTINEPKLIGACIVTKSSFKALSNSVSTLLPKESNNSYLSLPKVQGYTKMLQSNLSSFITVLTQGILIEKEEKWKAQFLSLISYITNRKTKDSILKELRIKLSDMFNFEDCGILVKESIQIINDSQLSDTFHNQFLTLSPNIDVRTLKSLDKIGYSQLISLKVESGLSRKIMKKQKFVHHSYPMDNPNFLMGVDNCTPLKIVKDILYFP